MDSLARADRARILADGGGGEVETMPGSTSLAREILLSLGTLVGSNITNPTLAVGVGAVISTYNVPQVVIVFDLPVKIVTAGMILACSHGTGGCRGSRRSA